MDAKEYIHPLSKTFEENTNEAYAAQMKKYVRDKFDFYGIKSPLRKEIFREFYKTQGPVPEDIKKEIITQLWNAPQRECQYVAMELLDKSVKKDNTAIIELYEMMILNKSWWDTIDYIAARLLGEFFKKHPHLINETTSRWMDSGNIWLQRCCLLFQLKYRDKLDTVLLDVFISRLKDSKEFFIRKAIGWILREYSKTNPSFVINYVDNNNMSNLSKREALLWMKRKGMIS